MQTRCPTCDTTFRIQVDQLKRADGKVRCGQCQHVFAATLYLQEELPFDAEQDNAPDATATPNAPNANVDIVEQNSLPFSLHQAARSGSNQSTYSLLWFSASLILITLLSVQYIYHQRLALIQTAEFQPWILHLCKILPCDNPPFADPSQIEMLNRNVFIHPTQEKALMINGTIVNNAPYAQPLPILEISLNNLRGQKIAVRRFLPTEYLSQSTLIDNMQPGVPVSFRIEALDPGQNALAYEFEFL